MQEYEIYFSPNGNPELWVKDTQPENYISEAEWLIMQKPAFAKVKNDALEALRLKKWEMKNAGISVNGIAIDTDDRGQATISGAVTNCLIDPEFTTNWKTSAVDENGASVWMVLDKKLILALSQALTSYTEACFAVEAEKQGELAALAALPGALQGEALREAEKEAVAAIKNWLVTELETGWPSQIISLG